MTTLTTKDIKRTYVQAMRNTSVWTEGERKAQKDFDSWLAEHDRKVKAEVWIEGYHVGVRDGYFGPQGVENPYEQKEQEQTPEVVHLSDETEELPCCGKAPSDVLDTDRLTDNVDLMTCKGVLK